MIIRRSGDKKVFLFLFFDDMFTKIIPPARSVKSLHYGQFYLSNVQ